MDRAEAMEWINGERSMTNVIPRDPFETWVVRIAQADAAMVQQAYYMLKHSEGFTKEDDGIGKWLSAALDDPKACAEFKADIHAWFKSKSRVSSLELVSPEPDQVDAAKRAWFERDKVGIRDFVGDTFHAALLAEEAKVATLKAGISAVQHLIEESYGVAGLHLNDDEVPWTELLKGGRFEAWLYQFSEALEVVKR